MRARVVFVVPARDLTHADQVTDRLGKVKGVTRTSVSDRNLTIEVEVPDLTRLPDLRSELSKALNVSSIYELSRQYVS